jgi:hypothetical protein
LALQACDSGCLGLSLADADLQAVISNWKRLPVAIRNAIVALGKPQDVQK